MAGEQPLVAKRDDDRDLTAKRRQLAEVEVTPVQVMRVQDVRRLRRQLKEPPGLWVMEVFAPADCVEVLDRRGEPLKRAARSLQRLDLLRRRLEKVAQPEHGS